MPTVMNPHHIPREVTLEKTAPQRVAIILGYALVLIGLVGMIIPGLMRMHLSVSHNLFHLVSGSLAIWCGYTTSKRAYNFCLSFGALYGFLGIAGFLMGEPGYPAFGNMEADQNLFRIIPNFLEFGTMDHLFHLLIAAFLIFTTYTHRKDLKRKL